MSRFERLVAKLHDSRHFALPLLDLFLEEGTDPIITLLGSQPMGVLIVIHDFLVDFLGLNLSNRGDQPLGSLFIPLIQRFPDRQA